MADNATEYIVKRKNELNAVILAHFYQRPEIQEIADFVGDSLQLAQKAADTQARAIFFCGVSFMAESAKILNPEKLVVLPEPKAGCPMADMIDGDKLRRWKSEHPEATVVTYVNSSAEVKAESDVCCTSSNAIAVVNSIPEETPILFVPDQNLGAFVSRQTGRRNMISWPGFCPTHHHFKPEAIKDMKSAHPEAVVIVHPECRPEIVDLADEALSTGGMLKYVENSSAQEFIIGTEEGLMYQLRKRFPSKTFYLAHEKLVCPNMKLTTIDKLAYAMESLEPSVEVPEDIRLKAYNALDRMLRIS